MLTSELSGLKSPESFVATGLSCILDYCAIWTRGCLQLRGRRAYCIYLFIYSFNNEKIIHLLPCIILMPSQWRDLYTPMSSTGWKMQVYGVLDARIRFLVNERVVIARVVITLLLNVSVADWQESDAVCRLLRNRCLGVEESQRDAPRTRLFGLCVALCVSR